MAQAQVVISAVDRTQVAINSALRGMKTLERTAKVTSKAINIAFGLFTGSVLISTFGKITEAAKKTGEGRKALEELNKALNDPTVVAAANSLTTILVTGFAKAATGITSVIKLIRGELVALGAVGPLSAAEGVKKLEAEIERIKSKYKFSVKGETIISPISEADRATIANLETRIAALSSIRPAGGGSRGRFYAGDRDKIERNLAKMAFEEQKKAEAKALDAAKKANDALLEKEVDRNIRYQELQKTVGELPALYENVFDAAQFSVSKSTQAILDDLNAKEELFASFARDTASAMTNAFADFLFDPFENGLRGMLKGFLDVVRQIIAQIAAVEILTAVFSPFAGGSGLGGRIYNALTKRAMGGPVSMNTPYIVGERGPELFVPNSSGSIVPNNKMGGVTVAPVYNIDARGATADLQKSLPGILQENNRRIFDELDRRYGIGR